MALDIGGAAGGAIGLREVIEQKLKEQQVLAQQRQFAQKLAEDQRQANMVDAVQRGNLDLGGRRVDEDVRQFDAQAPLRIANVGHLGAETESLNRAPAEAQKQRDFAAGQGEAQRTFTGRQGELNRGNAVRIAGINGVNAMNVANVRHPDPSGTTQTQKEQNEVDDALSLIDEIEKDPSLNSSVGPMDQYTGMVTSGDPAGVNRFDAHHKQLVGKMQLAIAGKLKGQGQISDKERAMLQSAATSLTRGLSEADYKAELGRIRGQFQRMRPGGGASINAAPEFDYVPGKGLVARVPK